MDAREAQPLWLTDESALLQVRAKQGQAAGARARGEGFDLWRVPGRKRLTGSGDSILSVSIGSRHARIVLDAGLHDTSATVCTVPLTARLRGQLSDYQVTAALLKGEPMTRSIARPVTRAGLLHLHALQALDAAQARVSHRDLAAALFGAATVRAEWHADGGLRARVRHLIARADGMMRHGYRALAGVHTQPGDEDIPSPEIKSAFRDAVGHEPSPAKQS